MPINKENEKLIREFLFGDLPEQKRFEFEETFIKDNNLFEQIKVVEDELIEKYVRGWMNPAEHTKFEQNFLTTGKRRERVEFSRLFINKIRNTKTKIAADKNNVEKISNDTIWEKLGGLFLTPSFTTAAALILIAIFGSWILYRIYTTEKTELAIKPTANQTDTPQTTQTPPIVTPLEETTDETETDQNESDEDNTSNSLIKEIPKQVPKVTEQIVQKTPTPQPTPKIETSAPNPVLALFAGNVRSSGKNNVLNLPEKAKGATFRLNLETVDYEIFQAELTDADGFVIFKKENLKSQKLKINLFVPAENLQKGDYLIKLSGQNDFGDYESVADFQFRVK